MGQGLDDVRAQALAGRVDDDHIGGESPGLELQGGLTGVAAEELGVCDAVSAGVVPGVGYGLGLQLHADDLTGGPGHGQGDGPHAAIQVQDRVGCLDFRALNGHLI